MKVFAACILEVGFGRDCHTNELLLAQLTGRCNDSGASLRHVPEVHTHPASALHPHDANCQSSAIRHLWHSLDLSLKQRGSANTSLWWSTTSPTAEVQRFIWKNIITRFDIPRAIIFDNSRQFDTAKLTDYLGTLGCQAKPSSPLLLTLRPTVKPKQPTNPFSTVYRKSLIMPKENGRMNYMAFYGPYEPLRKQLLVRLRSCWPMGPKLPYALRSPSTLID